MQYIKYYVIYNDKVLEININLNNMTLLFSDDNNDYLIMTFGHTHGCR